jgi:membrane protease YdiL (CAAX protease family)
VTRTAPISIALAFSWTLVVAFCLWALVSASVMLRPSSATDPVQLCALEALVFVSGILWVQRFHGTDAPLGASLGIRATHPLLPVLALFLGFSVHFPAESVDALVQRFFPQAPGDVAAEAALLSAPTPGRLVLVLVVIACIGPLVEELFFRGALFGALRRSHSLLATTLAVSGCFVVGHLSVRHWPALAVVSIALTWVRAVTGSLLPGLALHVAFNASTVLAFAMGEAATEIQKIELIPTISGFAATAVLVFSIQYVAAHAKAARRGRAEDVE